MGFGEPQISISEISKSCYGVHEVVIKMAVAFVMEKRMAALFSGFAGLGLTLSPGRQSDSGGPPVETFHAMNARTTIEEVPASRLKDDGSIRMPLVRQSGDDVRRKA